MLIDGSRRVLGNQFPYDGQSMFDFILLEGEYIQTSSIMTWRRHYPRISFDESLRRDQDWDFAINAEMAGCIFIYMHDALVEYFLIGNAGRISAEAHCEPSLAFLEKYNYSRSLARQDFGAPGTRTLQAVPARAQPVIGMSVKPPRSLGRRIARTPQASLTL